jgi:hypothetical protein
MSKKIIAGIVLAVVALVGVASVADAQTATFNTNLTVGSTGADVVALQQFLVAKGHLVMPAGVAYGYFGPLTRAAVAKYQTSKGITPAVGYFGPITRAAVNAEGGVTTTPSVPGCPAGALFNYMTGQPCSTTPTTPSTGTREGNITVTLNASPAAGTKVYEGNDEKSVMAFDVKATDSDVWVKRVKIELGTSRTIYTRMLDRMYLYHGNTLLGSVTLNSSTVSEDSSGTLSVMLSGFNVKVAKDARETFTVKIDAKSSIDSQYENGSNRTLTIPSNGVRATDEAGIDIYGPASAINRAFQIHSPTNENAALSVARSGNTPDTGYLVGSSNNNEDGNDIEVLRFRVEAEDDDVTVDEVGVQLSMSGTATATAVKIYRGSTLLGSASNNTSSGTTTVELDNDLIVDEGGSVDLIVKIDYVGAGYATSSVAASVYGYGINAENSEGEVVSPTGSAVGNTLYVFKAAPEFTLVNTSVTRNAATQSTVGTVDAQFVFDVTARGDRIYFANTGAFQVEVFRANLSYATSTATGTVTYSKPSNATTDGSSWYINKGETARVTVSFVAETSGWSVSSYDFRLSGAAWRPGSTTATARTATFLPDIDESRDFQTSNITLP